MIEVKIIVLEKPWFTVSFNLLIIVGQWVGRKEKIYMYRAREKRKEIYSRASANDCNIWPKVVVDDADDIPDVMPWYLKMIKKVPPPRFHIKNSDSKGTIDD